MQSASSPSPLPLIHNRQPAEHPVQHERSGIDIVSVYLTIQGEGPFSGHPAVFLRCAGCNLQCPLCDTNYTTGRRVLSPPEIVAQVISLRKTGLVVITGGEPFRQRIAPLVKMLLNTGFRVQLETNGTFYEDRFPYHNVTVVCSPKTPKIHSLLPVHAYKYVLDAEHIDEQDGLPTAVLGLPLKPARPRTQDRQVPIYVVPADERDPERNERNLQAAIEVTLRHGYILCNQNQKIWRLP